MDEILDILRTLPWFAWIAIVGILCGTISSVLKMKIQHQERMAMIQQGMHPDYPVGKKRPGIETPFVE